MKHNRILAFALAAVMAVGVLSVGVLAADTDGTSRATQKTGSESAAKEKPQGTPQTGSTGSGGTQTGAHGRKGCGKEQAAEPEGAVGREAAGEIAVREAGLEPDQVEKLHVRVSDSDGTPVYKVRFSCDGQRYSCRIDALSGEILESRTREDTGKARGPCTGRKEDAAAGQGDA